MRITNTYGWTSSPSFTSYAALLEEFKSLLMDGSLEDIPAPLKGPYNSTTWNYSYGIRGYCMIRKVLLECLGLSEDDPDISQYCDVLYPDSIFTSSSGSSYRFSCVVTRIVDSKASDATNRVYYLIGTLYYHYNYNSNTENYVLENVILCESLGNAENERNLSLSTWGKPFQDSSVGSYHWNFNLPITESKIVSQSLSKLYSSSNSSLSSWYYICNAYLNNVANMALAQSDDSISYSTSYSTCVPTAMFNSSGSSFKVQGHVDDNGILTLIYTCYNNTLNIKRIRFPSAMLNDINSYTCIVDVYNSRFGIYANGSSLGLSNDTVFSAYSRSVIPTMNTLDTLLAGPKCLYNASADSSQLASAYVFGIVQTPYYITSDAASTHNFTGGQLLQGNTYIYAHIGALILPWDPSVTWMSLSS